MPMLTPTDVHATVRALLINDSGDDLTTSPLDTVEVDWNGFVGEVHGGTTRAACTRTRLQYPPGTTIRNVRQVSALSVEQIGQIAAALELDALEPAWLGANLVVEGIEDFSGLPPSSRLIGENGTSLVVDMENAPCRFPGEIIERHRPGHGKRFPKVATGRRGVTLWVERPGRLSVGDRLRLHVPPVVRWQAPTAVRAQGG